MTTAKRSAVRNIRRAIARVLAEINDPELGADIVSLGLIYGIEKHDSVWRIRLTMTTPGCPLIGYFQEQIHGRLSQKLGLTTIDIQVIFDPPWRPAMMEPELRAAYQIGEV